MEMSRYLLDITNKFKKSMISLIHQACLWIEILFTILNFSPMLSLTADVNIECLQLNQQKQEGK